jgi:5-methylcytosine-specific restriction endonuclease McrA
MSKTCNSCNVEKSIDFFSPSKKGKLGRRSKCKPCEAEINRARRLENPEASRAAVERYRLSHPQVIARRDARYYQKHKDKKNKQTTQWRKNNPDKYAELNRRKEHIRRARKLNNGQEPYTESQVLSTYGTNCHICDTPINLKAPRKVGVKGWELGLHIDHVVPLVKGGPDSLGNVKPAHGKCNLQKNSMA